MIKKAIKTYKYQGLRGLLTRGRTKTQQKIRQAIAGFPPVDKISRHYSEQELAKLRTAENRRELDSVLSTLNQYSGYGLYRTLKPLQNPVEHRQLIQAVDEHQPRTILEIGTANGGTLYPWCRYIDGVERIIALDIDFWGRDPDFYTSFVEDIDREIHTYTGESQSVEMRKQIISDLNPTIDFLFIDGDHSYTGVKRDFELYSDMVPSGGLIAFHDIRGDHERCGVGTLWNELKDKYSTTEFHDSDGPENWGGVGILKKVS